MTEHSPTDQGAAFREGASIAVFDGRQVLLVKRKRAPFAGLWSLPGGKTERGETPRETACRELMEETGITADIEGLVDIVKIAAEDEESQAVTYRLAVFYGRASGGSLEPGADTEAARWADFDAIEGLPMTPGTVELIWTAAHRLSRS
jgi:ADP-ribose pyrophosphatase YjhB (NUDIX family)